MPRGEGTRKSQEGEGEGGSEGNGEEGGEEGGEDGGSDGTVEQEDPPDDDDTEETSSTDEEGGGSSRGQMTSEKWSRITGSDISNPDQENKKKNVDTDI